MSFFQQLFEAIDGVTVTITAVRKNDKLTLSVLPGSNTKDIAPAIITGTPEELEEGFFPAMRHPIDQVKGLQVQMDEFQKSANAVKDQAEKKKTPEKKTEKKAEKKPAKKNEKPEPVQPDFFTQAENDAPATEDGPKGEESNPADDQ